MKKRKTSKYPIKQEIIVLAGLGKNIPELDKITFPQVKLTIERDWKSKPMLSEPDMVDFLRQYMGDLIETQEQFVVLYLNHANEIIGLYRVSLGGTAATAVDSKLIFSMALKLLAESMVICHNHPSGNTKPSGADIVLTRKIDEECKIHSIELFDHIIITKDGHYSFASGGNLKGIPFPITGSTQENHPPYPYSKEEKALYKNRHKGKLFKLTTDWLTTKKDTQGICVSSRKQFLDEVVELDFGVNQTGQHLRNTFPMHVLIEVEPDNKTSNTPNTMNVNRENIAEIYAKLDKESLPKSLRQELEDIYFITQHFVNWDALDLDEDVSGIEIDTFKDLETFLAQQHPQPKKAEPPVPVAPTPAPSTSKAKAEPKPKKERKPKPPKAPKPPKTPRIKIEKPKRKRISEQGTPVENVDIAVRFIKRYVSLDGKVTDRDKIRAFITTLQRAIRIHAIRKTHKYATEIMHIQKELIRLWERNQYSAAGFTVVFDNTDKVVMDAYRKIGYSERPMKSILLIKQFLSIQGKKGSEIDLKAEKLQKSFNEYLFENDDSKDDKYLKELAACNKSLIDFIKGRTASIDIPDQTLNGLNGIAGCCQEKKNDMPQLSGCGCSNTPALNGLSDVVTVGQLHDAEFARAGYQGKWLILIGDPSEPYSMMIWSKPGKGKSSLMIEFAQYLSHELNKRVLFVSKEEGLSYTLQDKFVRMGATDPKIEISPDKMPEDLSKYDYVIVDSITALGFSNEDLEAIKQSNPTVSFVWIVQSTVDGDYRGSKDKEHMVDVSIYINELGFAQAQKSRFGGTGTIKVFSDTTVNKVYKFTGLLDAEKYQRLHQPTFHIFHGDDGKYWVVDQLKAAELTIQGFVKIQ